MRRKWRGRGRGGGEEGREREGRGKGRGGEGKGGKGREKWEGKEGREKRERERKARVEGGWREKVGKDMEEKLGSVQLTLFLSYQSEEAVGSQKGGEEERRGGGKGMERGLEGDKILDSAQSTNDSPNSKNTEGEGWRNW